MLEYLLLACQGTCRSTSTGCLSGEEFIAGTCNAGFQCCSSSTSGELPSIIYKDKNTVN